MSKNLLFCIAIFWVGIFYPGNITAQESTREIGLRIFGFEDFDLMYKYRTDRNTFKRIRFIFGNFDLNNQDESLTTQLNLGVGIGKEKRITVNEKIQFLHGPEFRMVSTIHVEESNYTLAFSPGFGYILGFQYNLFPDFYFSLETIPGIYASFGFDKDGFMENRSLHAGFDSNAIALSMMLRF